MVQHIIQYKFIYQAAILYHEMLQRSREQPGLERSELDRQGHVARDQRPVHVLRYIARVSRAMAGTPFALQLRATSLLLRARWTVKGSTSLIRIGCSTPAVVPLVYVGLECEIT